MTKKLVALVLSFCHYVILTDPTFLAYCTLLVSNSGREMHFLKCKNEYSKFYSVTSRALSIKSTNLHLARKEKKKSAIFNTKLSMIFISSSLRET